MKKVVDMFLKFIYILIMINTNTHKQGELKMIIKLNDFQKVSTNKFYNFAFKTKNEIEKLVREIENRVNIVTIEDQINQGKTQSFKYAELFDSNKNLCGCVIYIKISLLKKIVDK